MKDLSGISTMQHDLLMLQAKDYALQLRKCSFLLSVPHSVT